MKVNTNVVAVVSYPAKKNTKAAKTLIILKF